MLETSAVGTHHAVILGTTVFKYEAFSFPKPPWAQSEQGQDVTGRVSV